MSHSKMEGKIKQLWILWHWILTALTDVSQTLPYITQTISSKYFVTLPGAIHYSLSFL